MNDQRIITVREAAKSLRVCTRVVYRLCSSGAIPAHKAGGSWHILSLPVKNRTLTPAEIAISRGVSVQLVRRMIADKRIVATKIGRRKWAISSEEAINILSHPGFLRRT
jgi:excisionase family DNA binding protein